MSTPSRSYNGLKKPSTNWINHQVMKNVTATGKRTTLQFCMSTCCYLLSFEISKEIMEDWHFGKYKSLIPSSHELLWDPTLENKTTSLKNKTECFDINTTYLFWKLLSLLPRFLRLTLKLKHNCSFQFGANMITLKPLK